MMLAITTLCRVTIVSFSLVAVLIMPSHAQERASEREVLTIQDAVTMAITQNLNVRAARSQVAAAGARIDIARAARKPQLGLTAEYRRISVPGDFTVPPLGPGIPERQVSVQADENVAATISARQEIYTGGRIRAQISRASALFDVSLGRLGTTEADISLQTREGYYSVLLAESLIRTAEKSLAAAREQLEAATAKFEVGTAPRFDVLRAETMVSEAEQDLVEVQNQAEVAEVALNRLLGVALDQDQGLAEPDPSPFPDQNLSSLIELALRERAELLSGRARLAAAEAGIRLAKSGRRPSFGILADFQTVLEETPAETTGFTFMATATLEIFDGGRISAEISEARALRDEAHANLEESLRAVEQDVRKEYLNLKTARQTLSTAGTRLAQAEEAHEVARVRYEAGVGTAVEVADALATLTGARTNLDRARSNYNIAYARLQRALGRVTY